MSIFGGILERNCTGLFGIPQRGYSFFVRRNPSETLENGSCGVYPGEMFAKIG